VQFEVEVHQDEQGQWVATAVLYQVTSRGRTESEALALLVEALARRVRRAPVEPASS
jgi:predicted RNase H-like HicB family nuclease